MIDKPKLEKILASYEKQIEALVANLHRLEGAAANVKLLIAECDKPQQEAPNEAK